jgi:hypothetical protein
MKSAKSTFPRKNIFAEKVTQNQELVQFGSSSSEFSLKAASFFEN